MPKEDKSQHVPQAPKLKDAVEIKLKYKLTKRQEELINLVLDKNTKCVFISGCAGSAKTYNMILAGLQLLNKKQVSSILYIRSAVESSDAKLGYLPGDICSKIQPYLEPLTDKLGELLSKNDIDKLLKENRIETKAVSFLRGLSWNAKFIIGDECISGKHHILTSNGRILLSKLYRMFLSGEPLPMAQSYNETAGKFEYKKILGVVDKGVKKVITITLANRKIVCTPDHKFLTEYGWIEAKDLNCFTPVIASNNKRRGVLDVMNNDQLQVFLGSFLGDGSVHNVANNRYRVRVIHGAKQENYCRWKADIFCSKVSFIEKNGYSQKNAFTFASKCFCLPAIIPSGPKVDCPQWVLDKIDARGIAIWYMDDGHINNAKNHIRIYTSSFGIESQRLFVKKFKEYGIECSIREDKGVDYLYYYLNFNSKNTKKLLELVRPYIHYELEYKLDYVSTAKYVFNNAFLGYKHVVPGKIIDSNGSDNVYDMEIEDNHNFLIVSSRRLDQENESGVVAHNCQNISQKEIVTLITRLGEFSKIVLCGDPMQSDINGKSGFKGMMDLFNNQESRDNGIFCFEMTEDDIVRSKFVKFVVGKLNLYKNNNVKPTS